MKPGLSQCSLRSLMIAIAGFAVVLTDPGSTAKFVLGAVESIRLMLILVMFIIATLVVFHYLVLAPSLWLIASVDRRLGAGHDDGRRP